MARSLVRLLAALQGLTSCKPLVPEDLRRWVGQTVLSWSSVYLLGQAVLSPEAVFTLFSYCLTVGHVLELSLINATARPHCIPHP